MEYLHFSIFGIINALQVALKAAAKRTHIDTCCGMLHSIVTKNRFTSLQGPLCDNCLDQDKAHLLGDMLAKPKSILQEID